MGKPLSQICQHINITADGNTHCCGLREIDGLEHYRDPEDAFLAIMCVASGSYNQYAYGSQPRFTGLHAKPKALHFAHAMFTQAGRTAKYGWMFKEFIEAHNLGKVVATEAKRNPNSGRPVTAFLWTPNKRCCANYWNRSLKAQPKAA